MNRAFQLVVLVCVCLIQAGCAGTRYGGKTYHVHIESTPAGATCYVATYKNWLAEGGSSAFEHGNRPGVVPANGSVKAPSDIDLPAIQHVIIAELTVDGKKLRGVSAPFTPSPTAKKTVPVSLE